MGWYINCMHNDLKITEACAKELFESEQNQYSTIWYELDEVTDEDGVITFNSDHMEHMDYLNDEDIQAILAKHKVNGEVHFNCADGDWAGDAWGHRFVDGKYTRLVGITTFIPEDELPENGA